MSAGDVLFYTGRGDIIGKLISWWTNSRFVHCGIDVGSGFTVEAMNQGIVKRAITLWKPAATWSYNQQVKDRDPEDMANALRWLNSMVGQHYGTLDVFGAAYEKLATSIYLVQINHYDCSALVTEFLVQAGGVDLGNLALDPHRVTPAILAKQLGIQ